MPKYFVRIFTSRSFRAEARQQRAEVETRSEAKSPEGKSASISASNPDFSASFAALTPVEMTSFIQSKIKTQRYGGQPFTSSERRATRDGFTLVELLVALIVSSVILAAVATLAFAMSSANVSTDDTSSKQSQVRYATLRISELIRHCKLICGTPGNDLAVWRADKNDDGQININELVYIERGQDANYLRLCEFPVSATSWVTLSQIETLSLNGYSVIYVPLLPQCSNVQFSFDILPPKSKFLSISFDLVENNVVRHYQINSALRNWAGNLLNDAGDAIVSDDD